MCTCGIGSVLNIVCFNDLFNRCAVPLTRSLVGSTHLSRRDYSSENKSFVMNSFVGQMETAELFPFPEGTYNTAGPHVIIVNLIFVRFETSTFRRNHYNYFIFCSSD